MKSLRLSAFLATACLAPLLQGCGGGHYYRITDPKSGEIYYTQSVYRDEEAANRPSSFVDARSGKRVTLDRLQVDVLDNEEYGVAISGTRGG
jgi:hypothetical protein